MFQLENIIKNHKSVCARTHKIEKIHFYPALTLIFPIFGESEKDESNIFKKVILGTFKE